MHKPIESYKHASYPQGSVTQWFGLNPFRYNSICYPDSALPSRKYCMAGHNGIDIVAPWGTPLLAVVDGIIGDIKNSPEGYGKHLRLYREVGGLAEEWTYGHCSEILVKEGQEVKAGDIIAKMGNTGFVVSGATPFWKYNPYAGTHLHLGKRYWRLWNGNGTYNATVAGKFKLVEAVDYYNGYFGSVDFAEELKNSMGQVDSPEEAKLRLTLNSLYNQLSGLIRK
jgi:murein DD-endopeptidase MepM/ murein hydrolase activator NlpD